MSSDDWMTTYVFSALSADITTEPVPADQKISGEPETGTLVLGTWHDKEVGVWDMTVGEIHDVEVDEICIIIAGLGEVERTLHGETLVQLLQPGVVVKLHDQEKTIWRVKETLRKIYLA
jgi:uncharacterized cupin superfamily protein